MWTALRVAYVSWGNGQRTSNPGIVIQCDEHCHRAMASEVQRTYSTPKIPREDSLLASL